MNESLDENPERRRSVFFFTVMRYERTYKDTCWSVRWHFSGFCERVLRLAPQKSGPPSTSIMLQTSTWCGISLCAGDNAKRPSQA